MNRDDDTLPLSAQRRIHGRCEEFIEAWQDYLADDSAGDGPPDIRKYLTAVRGAEAHKAFRELLDAELHYRRIHGEQPRREAYDRRFPQFPEIIAQVFQLGRYKILGLLGSGAFGNVYRALDPKLKREVAVKVPHADRIQAPEDVDAYLREAQILASLDHPNVVPVHDYGQTDDGRCYVVSKLIDGTNLRDRIKQQRLSFEEAARLVRTLADALRYAHSKRLVHRDIKPANIIIDQEETPFITDFGLAVRDIDLGDPALQGGTPAYMSPEQARGEGHRVDPRSDIFSLGVVLYELMTGHRPFSGSSPEEVIDHIKSPELDAWLPSSFAPEIPDELERICLKCLAKRTPDRYPHAQALAIDLQHFLSVSSGPNSQGETTLAESRLDDLAQTADKDAQLVTTASKLETLHVVPKGLRSFDREDADFFLELLPGPRHPRDGIRESIRFWKTRLEEMDPENTFSVGVIYGPSGCGKSSFVKAGLMPRLASNITPVYVEAVAEGTETRLLRRLRRKFPALPQQLPLVKTMTALRQGQGAVRDQKILIVLDQFEQWLHTRHEFQDEQLVQSLRHCDGARVQVIALVRDDFWLAVSRLMRDLEVPLVDGANCALVDLFDASHARKVLEMFGRAYGRLGPNNGELHEEQKQFLTQAIAALADDRKVVCVRLALFAEMMKDRPWTLSSLQEVGGATGLGTTFLEETFSASTAPPEHRLHQKGARAVLNALLMEPGTDIKGRMKSYDELRDASGYDRHEDFDRLVEILDRETRLITPADPEGVDLDVDPSSQVQTAQRFYQLSHDYLVPSLRDWLTRKQRETPEGRAELCLVERAAEWSAKREDRYLPSWPEYVGIRRLTDKSKWSESQREMMNRARIIVQGKRTMTVIVPILAVVVTIIAVGGTTASVIIYRAWDETDKQKNLVEQEKDRAVAAEADATNQKNKAIAARVEADEQKEQAIKARVFADEQKVIAVQAKIVAEDRRQAAVKAEREAEKQRQLALESSYVFEIGLVGETIQRNSFERAIEILEKHIEEPIQKASRGWEWGRLMYLATKPVARFSDGRNLTHRVESSAISRDTGRIVAGTLNGLVYVWEHDDNRKPARLSHGRTIRCVAISDDGRYVAAAGDAAEPGVADNPGETNADYAVKIWTTPVKQGAAASSLLRGHDGPVLSVALATIDGELHVLTGGADGTARLWRHSDSSEVQVFYGHAGAVWSARFSADGRRIVTAGEDGTVRVWSTQTGREVVFPRFAHAEPVYAAEFSPDGKFVVSGGRDRRLLVWNVPATDVEFDERRAPLEKKQSDEPSIAVSVTKALGQHNATVRSISFSEDGQIVVSAGHDNAVRIWDFSKRFTNDAQLKELRGHSRWVLSCAVFTKDDAQWVLSSGYDSQVKLWDWKSYEVAQVLREDSEEGLSDDNIDSATYSRDGRWVATASVGGLATVWDMQDPQNPRRQLLEEGYRESATADVFVEESRRNSANFSSDGQFLVCGGTDRSITGAAKIWHFNPQSQKWESAAKLISDSPSLNSAVFHPQSSDVILTASDGGQDGEIGKVEIWQRQPDGTWNPMTLGGPTHGAVHQAIFSPDGTRVLAMSEDGLARIWNYDLDQGTARPLGRSLQHKASALCGTFSRNGQWIAVGCGDGTTSIWKADWNAGSIELVDTQLGRHTQEITAVAFSLEDEVPRRLLTASRDFTVRLWDTADLENPEKLSSNQLLTLEEHSGEVMSVEFSPHDNGLHVLTAGKDGRVIIRPSAPIENGDDAGEGPVGAR